VDTLLLIGAGGGVGSVQHVDCEVVMVHNLHGSSSERPHPPPLRVIPKYRLLRVRKELKAQQAVCVCSKCGVSKSDRQRLLLLCQMCGQQQKILVLRIFCRRIMQVES
jgi:hypothetical protein